MDHLPRASAPKALLATATALFSLVVVALSILALPAVLVRAAADFGLTTGQLAGVTSAQFIAFLVATTAGGILADRIGRKPVLLGGCILLAAGGTVWACAGGIWTACAAGAALGAAGGIMESLASVLLSDLYPHRRKFFLNLSQVAFSAGAVGGPLLVGYLLPHGLPWRVVFAVIACLAAVLFILYAFAKIPRGAGASPATAGNSPTRTPTSGRSWGWVLRPAFLVPCIATLLYVLAEFCVTISANPYLFTRLGAPERWAVHSLSFFWMTIGIGRLACAFVPERVPYEKVIAALFLASTLTLIAQGATTSWASSIALFTIAGLFCSGIWPLLVGLTAARHPGRSASAVGLVIALGALGGVLAPPLMSALFAWLPASCVFPALGVPLLLGGVLILLPQGGEER